MQTFFEVDFAGSEKKKHDAADILTRNIDEAGMASVDAEFAEELLSGIEQHEEDILSAMRENAPQWPLDRMDKITRVILMIGTYELLFSGDAPPAVVMNEAIDIAKEFGSEESGKFVNGVLNAIAHS